MQPFAPRTLLAVWEAGRQQHELDRALTLLAAASPGATRAELASLSIGERDARLLQLRALVVGADAAAFTECDQCSEQIEFTINTASLAQEPEATEPGEFSVNGSRVRFRLPNSHDLAEVLALANANEGARRLADSCVMEITPPDHRPADDELIAAMSEAILRHDPRIEITLELTCPECDHRWEAFFDVSAFFWKEITAMARRLLREVDVIARAYGWSEGEILNLSPQRRQSYLELIAA